MRPFHAPNFLAVAEIDFLHCRDQRSRRHVIPAAIGAAALGFEARDVEPVPGPRHGDVEEAIALFRVGLFLLSSRPFDGRNAVCALDAPDDCFGGFFCKRMCAKFHETRRCVVAGGCGAGVGKEDDRRFEAFCAVHGHDANFVAAVLHVALHLRVRVAKLR